MADLYELLEVPRTATPDEIKTAYRKLARQYHPDVNPNNPAAEEKFKEISSAYAVLSDPDKKAQYDRTGSNDFDSHNIPGDMHFHIDEAFIRNIFNGMGGFGVNFGRAPWDSQPVSNSNIRVNLQIDINEMFTYPDYIKVKYQTRQICPSCQSQGASEWEKCPGCDGTGVTIQSFQGGQYTQHIQQPCGFCQGRGKKIIQVCQTCSGFGTVQKDEEADVPNDPKNFFNYIVLSQKGNLDVNASQPPGDLHILIEPVVKGCQVRPQDLAVEKHVTVDVLNFLTKNTLTLPGIKDGETVSIDLKTDQHVYVVDNYGMPLNKSQRSQLIYYIQPMVVPIQDNNLIDSIKTYLNKG